MTRRSKLHFRQRGQQRGVVLVALLVCLLIVMLLSGALVRGVVVQHRLARTGPQRLQAFWIAESAVQRGISQLETAADYEGETWRIVLTRDGMDVASTAVIRIEPVAGKPQQRAILVEARSPDDAIDGVLEQRRIIVPLPGEGDA